MSKTTTTIVKEGGGGVPTPNPNGAQWTVIGLLVVLVGLEMMRSQYMRDAWKYFFSQFNTNLANPGKPTNPPAQKGTPKK